MDIPLDLPVAYIDPEEFSGPGVPFGNVAGIALLEHIAAVLGKECPGASVFQALTVQGQAVCGPRIGLCIKRIDLRPAVEQQHDRVAIVKEQVIIVIAPDREIRLLRRLHPCNKGPCLPVINAEAVCAAGQHIIPQGAVLQLSDRHRCFQNIDLLPGGGIKQMRLTVAGDCAQTGAGVQIADIRKLSFRTGTLIASHKVKNVQCPRFIDDRSQVGRTSGKADGYGTARNVQFLNGLLLPHVKQRQMRFLSFLRFRQPGKKQIAVVTLCDMVRIIGFSV